MEKFYNNTEQVTESGCLIWMKFIDRQGYGSLRVNGKMWKAHRYSYNISVGSIPDGMQVLHKCDTPSCVNPRHLFLGTNKDNVNDKMAKGRFKTGDFKGENHPSRKLSNSDILEIRRRRECGETLVNISKTYQVTTQLLSKICNNKLWRHI